MTSSLLNGVGEIVAYFDILFYNILTHSCRDTIARYVLVEKHIGKSILPSHDGVIFMRLGKLISHAVFGDPEAAAETAVQRVEESGNERIFQYNGEPVLVRPGDSQQEITRRMRSSRSAR